MGKPRKRRRRRRRSATVGDRIEEAGRATLLGVWSLCVRIVRYALAGLAKIAARGWGRFRQFSGFTQGVVIAGLALLGAAAFYLERSPDPPADPAPIYVDGDTEALARVIRSEIGVGTPQQRLHVAWATRNLAEARGESVAEMACSPCGRQGTGRPVSSRQPATDRDRGLAQLVLEAPARLDPTGGATHFINPRLQDQLARRGAPGYRGRPYQKVRRIWRQSYGWKRYYRLGPTLEFWGP